MKILTNKFLSTLIIVFYLVQLPAFTQDNATTLQGHASKTDIGTAAGAGLGILKDKLK